MKNENKVFSIYILIILVYGISYWITSGKSFAFSPAYSDFGLGLISLGLFFHKKINKYSILLVSIGFSLFYLIAATEGSKLIDQSGFIQIKNFSLIAFSWIVLWDLYKGRYKSLKIELGILAFIILTHFTLRIAEVAIAFTEEFSFVKNVLGFALVVWMLRKNDSKNSFSTPLKRVVIVIGLSFFIEIMTYLLGL